MVLKYSFLHKLHHFSFVATASVFNIILMRNHELSEGIEVLNKEGEVVGTSVVAAREVLVNV